MFVINVIKNVRELVLIRMCAALLWHHDNQSFKTSTQLLHN